MKYSLKSFSVAAAGSDEYRKRWEETFRRVNGSDPSHDTLPTVRKPTVTCARCSQTFADFDGYRLHVCKPAAPPEA